jgi:hypothetical protein
LDGHRERRTTDGTSSNAKAQGRLVETEQVWWDEERHPRFLDVDLASGLASLGLEQDYAQAGAASLRANVTPL